MISLVAGELYDFLLDRGDGKPVVTAQTVILPKPVLRNPSVGTALAIRRNTLFNFVWNEMPEAGVFDLKLKFHYRERSPETGNVFVPKSIEWTVAKNLHSNEHKMDGTGFYTTLRAEIEEDAQASRLFDSVDIIIWAGGKELSEFIRLAQANTGITSTQEIPQYTNLSEGIGIFSSRNVAFNSGYLLSPQTLDSLRNSSITEPLNFN